MDKQLIARVARALHEAMRHSPLFGVPPREWDRIMPQMQSEYRAVAHSALVAAGSEEVWIVTDESDNTDDAPKPTSVIVIGESREAVLASLAESHGGSDDLVWVDQGGQGWWFTTMYAEYPWVMVKHTIERAP